MTCTYCISLLFDCFDRNKQGGDFTGSSTPNRALHLSFCVCDLLNHENEVQRWKRSIFFKVKHLIYEVGKHFRINPWKQLSSQTIKETHQTERQRASISLLLQLTLPREILNEICEFIGLFVAIWVNLNVPPELSYQATYVWGQEQIKAALWNS